MCVWFIAFSDFLNPIGVTQAGDHVTSHPWGLVLILKILIEFNYNFEIVFLHNNDNKNCTRFQHDFDSTLETKPCHTFCDFASFGKDDWNQWTTPFSIFIYQFVTVKKGLCECSFVAKSRDNIFVKRSTPTVHFAHTWSICPCYSMYTCKIMFSPSPFPLPYTKVTHSLFLMSLLILTVS